jgi:uncharacterized protein (TIGR00251 family)
MIEITDHAEGCVLRIRVAPGARKSGLVGEKAGALKVAVTAPASDGRANKAVLELLRKVFQLRRSQIELLSGEKSREKKVLIRGLSAAELRSLLPSAGHERD